VGDNHAHAGGQAHAGIPSRITVGASTAGVAQEPIRALSAYDVLVELNPCPTAGDQLPENDALLERLMRAIGTQV